MNRYDSRMTPARPDLAAKHLEGKVAAARFVAGTLREVVEPQAPLRRAPSPDAPLDTEALMGERVTVYEDERRRLGLGPARRRRLRRLAAGGRVARAGPPPTHKVAALRTFVFPGPSIKLPPIARTAARRAPRGRAHAERFAVTTSGAFVPARHLAPLDAATSATSSRWPSASWACPICGAARPASASTARA